MGEDARSARSVAKPRIGRGGTDGDGDVLLHRDGHGVRFLEEGADRDGRYLRIEHSWARPGR